MTTATTAYDERLVAPDRRRRTLRRIIAGAAPFDGAMGVFCLAAATQVASWLSVSTTSVRVTGVVFLVAAAEGVVTLARSVRDVRWIVAANGLFAATCLGVLAFDHPDVLGGVLLAGGAVCSGATAVAEHRLGRD
jgi:hypothetical protein